MFSLLRHLILRSLFSSYVLLLCLLFFFFFFFFNDTATTEIYTLSLHDALPISAIINGTDELLAELREMGVGVYATGGETADVGDLDRKSTRLNSSHVKISYAVFCLKKKKKRKYQSHKKCVAIEK